jgi:hypothetical protein
MHTAVHLTFSFEIAALQLTPSFKMGSLQLRPTSRIVSMRLAPSQHPHPIMNLQVTFEIANVQLTGNAIGTIRLTPSHEQRPNVTGPLIFNIAAVQMLSGEQNAGLQLTPGQGEAAVQVTGRYQIATVEFSPSFEIAALVLKSTSRQGSVQLPGSAESPIETAPVFDIANVQLGANGEIATMQLNAEGRGTAVPAMNRPVEGSFSVRAEVNSASGDLAPFHKVLEEAGVGDAELVTPCLKLSFGLPGARSSYEFVEQAVAGRLRTEVDVTAWITSNHRLQDCIFLAQYESGQIRPLTAVFRTSERGASLIFSDPLCFIDPAIETGEFQTSFNTGSLDFIAARLPTHA